MLTSYSYWYLTLRSALPSRTLSDIPGLSSTARAAACRLAADPAPSARRIKHDIDDGVMGRIFSMCTMYEGVDVAGATMQSWDCHSGVLGSSYTSCGVYTWHTAFVLDMKQCNDSKFKVHLDRVYVQSEEYDVKPTKRHRYALYDPSLFTTFLVVHMVRQLPVYLIKRPSVFEAAQKHLVYNVACMRFILDAWTSHHT
jgi:hypothetical protein